jgi:hypothetical protein
MFSILPILCLSCTSAQVREPVYRISTNQGVQLEVMIPGKIQCQRSLKTSHQGSNENQPL